MPHRPKKEIESETSELVEELPGKKHDLTEKPTKLPGKKRDAKNESYRPLHGGRRK